MKNSDTFEDFWTASELNIYSLRQFAAGINNYDSDNKQLNLEYPNAAKKLPKIKTKLNRLTKNRKSGRVFGEDGLSPKELAIIFSAFRLLTDTEHRTYPSAGATYVTEVFAVPFNSDLGNNIQYYDAKADGLVEIGSKAPKWKDACKALNIEVKGVPQLLLVFVIFPKRVTQKYGERGGRFALIEVGAAMQQLALQIANSKKLVGVAVGGMLDGYWLKQLRLENTGAKIALGYLVGK